MKLSNGIIIALVTSSVALAGCQTGPSPDVAAETQPVYQAELSREQRIAAADARLAGDAAMRQNNPSAAIEHYRRAVRLDPGSVNNRGGLTTALMTAGRHDEAIQILLAWRSRARGLAYSGVSGRLAEAYLASGNNREAAEARVEQADALQEVGFKTPEAISRMQAAELLVRAGEISRACENWQRAAKLYVAGIEDHKKVKAKLAKYDCRN